MDNTKRFKGLIKKINMIYKKGYMPAREKEKYSELHAKSVNCFGHACFNLSNDDLKQMDKYMPELKYFFRNFNSCGIRNYFSEAQNRIENVGLKIERSSLSEHVQKNQWKIAYYLMHDEFLGNDVHFMLQDRNGKWYSKTGSNAEIEVFNTLPKVFNKNYSLMGVYKITNPYIKLENEEDMEM